MDRVMLEEIGEKIGEATLLLEGLGYDCLRINPEELFNYLAGETPTGDRTTLPEILSNEYLMIHELVEICELKKMGAPIDRHTVTNYHPVVYEAHLVAAYWELRYALKMRDYAWMRKRLEDARSWERDELLPEHLRPRCRELLAEYSKYV